MLIVQRKNNNKNLNNLICMESKQKQNSILNLIKFSVSIGFMYIYIYIWLGFLWFIYKEMLTDVVRVILNNPFKKKVFMGKEKKMF